MATAQDAGEVVNFEPLRPEGDSRQTSGGLDSTAVLLRRLRGGDDQALNTLFQRYLPILTRWAHGRLPSSARDLSETDDLVQITLRSALVHIEGFEPRREGAFLAYLRQILRNKVLDEIRRVGRRPQKEEFDDGIPERSPSPVEVVIGTEMLEKYEAGLEKLPENVREAVILRIEMGLSYQEIADAVESPSANAARMMISRGLVQLSEAMHGDADGTV